MAVTRRNGKWQAAYRGPDRRERTRTFARKIDAEAWLASEVTDLARGEWTDPRQRRMTLEEYARDWLARMAPTWRASTEAKTRVSVESHILPTLGSYRLTAIRRSDVEALCASLSLAPTTVAGVHQHISQLLGAAVEDGLVPRNVASRARLPRIDAPKAQPVPLEVVARISAGLPDWLAPAVTLGVGAGLRQGEASGLTVDRVDFLRRTLRVDRQLVCRHVDAPTLLPPKTEASNRTIPLAGFVLDALADHLRRHPAGPGDFLLRTAAGGPVDSSRFSFQWRRACQVAGAPKVRYHDLRHTFASTLLSRGVSVKAVSGWLGHASPVVTLTTYAHLMPADEDVARTVLDAALAPVPAMTQEVAR